MNNKNNNKALKEAITRVVAYFDMFDWPLTVWEIWLNLEVKCELREVEEALENLMDTRCPLDTECPKLGFYFLSGREAIVAERLRRYDFTDRKFKRVLRVVGLLKFIPWIKLIAAANLFGDHNLKDGSDIDLFIVTEKNRPWISRFFSVGLIKLFGLRPDLKRGVYRDRICLSFFISEAAMNLRGVRLEQDIHFAHWLIGLKPIYEKEPEVYARFIAANGWFKEIFPNWQMVEAADNRRVKAGVFTFYGELAEMFLGGLEPQVKKLQLKILPRRVKELMNKSTNVLVNDVIIKTHVNDRREEYQKKLKTQMSKLKIYFKI